MASCPGDMDLVTSCISSACSALLYLDNSKNLAHAVQIFGNLLSEDSDIEVFSSFVSATQRACEEPCTRTRIQDYVSNVVPFYNDGEFVSHFRMSRSAYEDLRKFMGPHLLNIGGRAIPVDDKLLMTLWTLANQDSFRAIGDRFGVHKSTAHFIFISVCSAIAKKSSNFITWPTQSEQIVIEYKFHSHEGFPGIIGAVDGCHIPIEAPEGSNREAYYNRKKFFSVLLQGTCDNKKRFIDVEIGHPGSSHDAHVYQVSSLGQNLSELLPENRHLLGDSAYPLQLNLLVPYRDNGHLTPCQVHFNRIHSGLRSVIENAYGFLKLKWRRLKYLNMSNLETLPLVILIACCLHNHVLNSDYFDCDPEVTLEEAPTTSTENNVLESFNVLHPNQECENAIQKRETIATSLFS